VSSTLDVAIEPAIPDNTAFTVLRTLRKLGYEELQTVSRADHLLLTVRESDDAAITPLRVAEALSKAEVLFNPNKHRLAYASGGAATLDGSDEYEALVSDKDDDARRLLSLLRTTFGMDYLESVTRGVVWQLHERERAAPAERLLWACRMLLSNAVSQVCQVRVRPKRITLGPLGQSVREQNVGTAKELR
jgi:phosphoribosylformylglycinamidine (FGAM) synthase PurS component